MKLNKMEDVFLIMPLYQTNSLSLKAHRHIKNELYKRPLFTCCRLLSVYLIIHGVSVICRHIASIKPVAKKGRMFAVYLSARPLIVPLS